MDQLYGVVFYIFSILISIGFNVIFYLKGENTKLSRGFLALQGVIFVWILGKVLVIVSPNYVLSWSFTIIQYVGVCYFGCIFLHFAYFYQRGKRIKAPFSVLILFITTINYGLLVTNEYHHLFFSQFFMNSKSYGPAFYFHTLFSYTLIGISYMYLLKGLYQNNNDMEQDKKVLLTIGLGLPLAANILHVFVLAGIRTDITPIMFNVTFLIFGYVSYKYKFLDIRKIARHTIFENMQEGILVFDKNMKIIKYNAIMEQYAKEHLIILDHSTLDKFLQNNKCSIENYDNIEVQLKEFMQQNYTEKAILELRIHHKESDFIVQVEKFTKDKNVLNYAIFRFIDITKYLNAEKHLENKNDELESINRALSEELAVIKKLAIAKERNRVSKELHDIIGHSLTLVISLLDMSYSMVRKDRAVTMQNIVLTREIVREGFSELKKSFEGNTTSRINVYKLIEEIEKMGQEIASLGTHVEVIAKHLEETIAPKCYDAIYRMCQEGLTNAVRHGQASHIVLGIRFNNEGLDLVITDDGIGCKDLIKGNGLLGMEQRVKELNGTLFCGSPDLEGFSLHIKIPRALENISTA
ncbi:MAG: hypothetical protein CVV02_06495 [Firmicutes bacterium HGW-Firmicutes-7]|nr:MAG: hypothetical protein CVV02_06495 [Firmicutes bacterium HGW-Firmicutes-7]